MELPFPQMVQVGSIINLKPEFKERYIVLHQHIFPEVLKRISDSNIRNYSIFLREGLLFSYYEYHGKDLRSDLSDMASDSHTRDWWKLTDPMQEPFPYRSPDEWWAEMKITVQFENVNFSGSARRISLRSTIDNPEDFKAKVAEAVLDKMKDEIGKAVCFEIKNLFFLYAEVKSTFDEKLLISSLNSIGGSWVTSQEVFHTD